VFLLTLPRFLYKIPNSGNPVKKNRNMRTNFYLLNFWILTIALTVHLLTIQIPNIISFGFLGIVGTVVIYSIVPIILLMLSKKKKNSENTSTQIFWGYFFSVINILLSLYLIIGGLGALFNPNYRF